jgi:hypothetical protein
MDEALKGLPVEIVQFASDEGKGIVHHMEKDSGAHHSYDVFYVENKSSRLPSRLWRVKQRGLIRLLKRRVNE